MDGGRARRGSTRSGTLWRGALTMLAAALTMLLAAPAAFAATTEPALTAEAGIGSGGFVDVFATSASSALQVDGQDGKFPTTPMHHDSGSTRFYARLPLAPGQSVTAVTVRDTRADPPSTVTVDVRAISISQAAYDGTRLTITATATDAAMYPLTVEASGTVGLLPSPTPVDFPLTAPPRTITVSSGAVQATAPVVITGGGASQAGTAPAVPTGAAPRASVAAPTLTAPRGLATVVDGSGSVNATTFRTVIKSAPQGQWATPTIVDDTTNRPSILLSTWAAPADLLPRTPLSSDAVVVTFTASNGVQSSSVDVTVVPASDTVAVTTARAGAELEVGGRSTIPGATPSRTAPTQVVVYARATTVANPTGLEPDWVKVGSAAVDGTGAFSVRSQPTAAAQYVQYLVQTSRGSQLIGTLGQ